MTQLSRSSSALGLVTLLLAPSLPAQSDAVMFRGGPTHTGVYESPSAPTLSNVAWKFSTKGRFISTPAVHNGVVFAGNTDQSVYAINAADGTLKWKLATKGPVNSSPAVAGGLVFVSSVDGLVYAIDETTGVSRWTFKTEGERRFTAPGIHGAIPKTEMMADPFDVFMSSPVVDRGTVYIGSGDHNVYALNAANGVLKWKFVTGNVVHASPAISDGTVYVGSWDSYFYALNAENGQVRWKFETGRDTVEYNQVGIASSAAISGGVVYFGCRDGFLYALDAKTGKEKWKHDNHHGWVIASPAVHDGAVFFPTSDGTRFKALDATTGALRFDQANKNVSFSSPAVVKTTVIFGSSDGWLHAADTKSGQMLAEFQTDGSKEFSPKFIGPEGKMKGLYPDFTLGGMFIGMNNMMSLGSVLSSPVVANGVVFFGSTDGNLYALR